MTADEMQAQWDAVKRSKAKKKYEQENPYMLITSNAEGTPDTLRFNTPNKLEEYKRNMYEHLAKEQKAKEQKPENQLKVIENEIRLRKINTDEKYNQYGVNALLDSEGREKFGEKWEGMKNKKKGPDYEKIILDQNKKIEELDKSLMVREKDEKGKETEYLNSNYNDSAVEAIEKLKAAHKDTLNMAVRDMKFKSFADAWGAEPDSLKSDFIKAKEAMATAGLQSNFSVDPEQRVRDMEQIAIKYGFSLDNFLLLDAKLRNVKPKTKRYLEATAAIQKSILQLKYGPNSKEYITY